MTRANTPTISAGDQPVNTGIECTLLLGRKKWKVPATTRPGPDFSGHEFRVKSCLKKEP